MALVSLLDVSLSWRRAAVDRVNSTDRGERVSSSAATRGQVDADEGQRGGVGSG